MFLSSPFTLNKAHCDVSPSHGFGVQSAGAAGTFLEHNCYLGTQRRDIISFLSDSINIDPFVLSRIEDGHTLVASGDPIPVSPTLWLLVYQ